MNHSAFSSGIRAIKAGSYFSCFSQITGRYLRAGSPFYCPTGPEMADIGITDVCRKACAYCYTSSVPSGTFMPLEAYRAVLHKFSQLYQVALGGGEPTLHPDFPEVLRVTRVLHNVVPNYSTNGDHLTGSVVEATKRFCGAVAVTCHDGKGDIGKLECFKGSSVARIIHLLLSESTIETVLSIISEKKLPSYLDGIIVLLHKPCGRGARSTVFKASPEVTKIARIIASRRDLKMGFDSCLAPLFAESGLLPPETYDACEAARFSLYVDWNSRVSPCSFLQSPDWKQDFRENSLLSIWKGEVFTTFRRRLKRRRCECPGWETCLGGCPVFPEINLCAKSKRIRGVEK